MEKCSFDINGFYGTVHIFSINGLFAIIYQQGKEINVHFCGKMQYLPQFVKFLKSILKFFNLGPRSGCLFIVHHLWVVDYFLTIYPKSDYQIFRIQMDYGWMHALLFIIYNCTILSKIWNIITRSYYSWICCCTSVDF